MTTRATDFFAPLTRRASYTTRAKGKFYSYAYYRKKFRHEIVSDCAERCVYCDSHENEVGGRDAMELDHFRPWSRAEFKHLKDDPNNLLHVCGRCNRLKGANWPSTKTGQPHDGRVGFIDPFGCDRRDYFAVNDDGSLLCLKHPATYMARLLALDRPLLRLLRLRRILRKEVEAYVNRMLPELEAAKNGGGSLSREQLAEAAIKVCEFNRLLDLCDTSLDRLRDIASAAARMRL
jgi:hypothetical protein